MAILVTEVHFRKGNAKLVLRDEQETTTDALVVATSVAKALVRFADSHGVAITVTGEDLPDDQRVSRVSAR